MRIPTPPTMKNHGYQIASLCEIVRWLGEDDPTTRRLIEEILKMEEEHADDLANMLTKVAD